MQPISPPLQVVVQGTTFTQNTAASGGALTINATVNITVQSSSFSNNTATHYGGAVDVADAYEVNLIACNFYNNSAAWGGAIDYWTNGTSLVVRGSVLQQNYASKSGGGIFCAGNHRVSNGDAPSICLQRSWYVVFCYIQTVCGCIRWRLGSVTCSISRVLCKPVLILWPLPWSLQHHYTQNTRVLQISPVDSDDHRKCRTAAQQAFSVFCRWCCMLSTAQATPLLSMVVLWQLEVARSQMSHHASP